MAEGVIRIFDPAGGDFPIELAELRPDGSLSRVIEGAIPAQSIDTATASDILTGRTPASALAPFGRALYDALYQALGNELRDRLNGPESVLFLDIGPATLQAVPWETLYWPNTVAGGFADTRVAASHRLVRVYRPDWRAARPKPDGPLRILIALGARAGDSIGAESEIVEIERSVHDVIPAIDLQKVRGSRDDLYEAIKDFRPHVLHFIGHGSNNPPALEFSPSDGSPGWDWLASDIAASVGRSPLNDWAPNLAFLNACRTGAAAGVLAPVAGAFLAAGARATIAMQGDIQGAAAGKLAGTFYREIAAGASIDRAIHIGRDKLAGISEKQASFPAVTLRCAPPAVFPGFAKRPEYAKAEVDCPYLAQLAVFVNQVGPRRQLHQRLWPFREDGRRNLVLIRGGSGFGKTVLSFCLLDLAASLGHRVRYVRVGLEPVDYVKILHAIWGRKDPNARRSPLAQPLPLGPEHDLEKLLASTKDPEELYAGFAQALGALAKTQPVTFVLDDFQKKMDPGSFWTIWEQLFLSLGTGAMENVNVILVLNEDECTYYELDSKLTSHPELFVPKEEVKLGELNPGEFLELLDLYLSYRDPWFDEERRGKVRDIVAGGGLNRLRPLSIDKLEKKYLGIVNLLDLEAQPLRRRGGTR